MDIGDLCAQSLIATRALARALEGYAIVRTLDPNDFAHFQGDPAETLSLVSCGQVLEESYPIGSWDPAPVMVWSPGALVGCEGLSALTTERTSALRALGGCELIVVYRSDLRELAKRNHHVHEDVATVRAFRDLSLQGALIASSSSTVERRIARWLLHLDACSCDSAQSPIMLSQDLLASIARTTRPTANAVLRELVSLELISIGRSRILVCSRSSLEAWLLAT